LQPLLTVTREKSRTETATRDGTPICENMARDDSRRTNSSIDQTALKWITSTVENIYRSRLAEEQNDARRTKSRWARQIVFLHDPQ
jgi:hypothetical protein